MSRTMVQDGRKAREGAAGVERGFQAPLRGRARPLGAGIQTRPGGWIQGVGMVAEVTSQGPKKASRRAEGTEAQGKGRPKAPGRFPGPSEAGVS
jgi:hypothetical protein